MGSWKNDPRRYSREEIIRVAKDACDSILMLYRLIGESWNDALNQIEKLSAELDALAAKTDAYHDELNEKIDEVNNYLNTQIKNLEIRVENIENSIDAFGGLPSNANANEGDVLTVGANGVNEWRVGGGKLPHYYFGFSYNANTHEYSVLNDHLLYEGSGEEVIDPVAGTITIAKIIESDGIAVEKLSDYLRGACLLSAYVVDSAGNKTFAEIVDSAFDPSVGIGKVTFDLTSDKHFVAREIGNHYYPALFLRYNLFPIPSSPNIEWAEYIGGAMPVIQVVPV